MTLGKTLFHYSEDEIKSGQYFQMSKNLIMLLISLGGSY